MKLKVLILPLSLVVAVALAIFFVKPSFSEFMAARSELKEKTALLENLKSQNQKLQNVKSKWDSLGEEQTLVATALPETESVDAYISELFSKAARSGILLSDVKIEQANQGAGAATSPAYVCSAASGEGLPQGAPSPEEAGSPDAIGGGENPAGQATVSANCLKATGISMTAKGTWEQMLDFFKYLEDMNRISETGLLGLDSGTESAGQPASDLLTASISLDIFFKPADSKGSVALAQELAARGNFNQKAIEKMKTLIYAPYNMPAVSPGSERNLFK